MRYYKHIYHDNQLMIPDKRSAKAHYGINCPEYLDSHDPHFLREGVATFGKDSITVYQLTEQTLSIDEKARYKDIGEGFITVEAQQFSGGFTECQVHKSRVEWK